MAAFSVYVSFLGCVCLLSLQDDLHYVTEVLASGKGQQSHFSAASLQVVSALREQKSRQMKSTKNQKTVVLQRLQAKLYVGKPVILY